MEHKVTTGQINSKTREMVFSGILIALVFIATKFINIRLPISVNGGLIHLGNVMLFTAAIVFGKNKGAISGAFGMALFDMVSGWMIWAPATFIIRGVMGYIIGSIAWSNGKNGNHLLTNVMAILVGGLWMMGGYYVAEAIIYGNWITPITSMPGDIIQVVAGAILGLPLISAIKRTKLF